MVIHRHRMATFTLSGTADAAKTRSVLVNGVPATWSAQDGTWRSGGPSETAESLVVPGPSGSTSMTAVTRARSGRASTSTTAPGGAARQNSATATVERSPQSTADPPGSRYHHHVLPQSFTASNILEYFTLRLRLLRDDGAVVYLNGVEVCRSNMPDRGDRLHNAQPRTDMSGQTRALS